MIPSECAGQTTSRAETGLFTVLRESFDDGWTIFHSFGLLAKGNNYKITDAEIDFLFFHKEFGLLVLEVKGGAISFADGEWRQNGWKLDKSPAEQASRGKYAVMKYIKTAIKKFVPCSFAHAVCFPDCYDVEELPPDCAEIVVSGREIPYIADAVRRIMRDFNKYEIICGDETAALILRKLAPAFEYGVSVADKIMSSEPKIISLTELQCDMLSFISDHKRALIRGCAGSGKTVMALKKAGELAFEGKNVLLLSYNSMLCEKLQWAVTDIEDKVTAITYHDLCIKHIRENGVEINPQRNDDELWTETIPEEFLKALDKKVPDYDAVIVDEGQDFRNNYWKSIERMVKPDGWFYIFYDPDQNLFNKTLDLPQLGNSFIMNKNCRNTQEIFKKLKPYCSGDVRIADDAPQGTAVIEFKDASPEKRRAELARMLENLIQHEKIYERQIVVLGGHSMAKTCIGDNPRLGSFEIIENGKPDIGKIPYFTYMKYKGCESDVVILIDIAEDDIRWEQKGLCAAISRAKHMLCVIRK